MFDIGCRYRKRSWYEQANRHILEHWNFPVHEDFLIPAAEPTLTVLTPVIQLADNLLVLDLGNHWRHGKLDDGIDALTRQVEDLAQVPREAEDLLGVLMIQAFVRSSMNHLMLAIGWGGDPGNDFSENKLHEPADTKSILFRWGMAAPTAWLSEISSIRSFQMCMSNSALRNDRVPTCTLRLLQAAGCRQYSFPGSLTR
ncbi:MAG TPA: hypothetical protein VKO85_01810 [Wenzhouxiangellaceae bacterium]|nr:hypothetical protein [Wenzhouxiangellaceae bacterium]